MCECFFATWIKQCGQFYWRSWIRNQSLIRVSDNLHFPSIIAVELSEYDVCHMLDWLIMMTSSDETFLALLALCEGRIHRPSVDSSHNGQWRETSMFSLISATTNGWPNNRCVGDLRRHPGHYDATVMTQAKISLTIHPTNCTPVFMWMQLLNRVLYTVG